MLVYQRVHPTTSFFSVFASFWVSKTGSAAPSNPGIPSKNAGFQVTTSELWHGRETGVPKETSPTEKQLEISAVEVITPTKITDFFLKKRPCYKGNFVFQASFFRGKLAVSSQCVLLMDWSQRCETRWLELRILAYTIRFQIKSSWWLGLFLPLLLLVAVATPCFTGLQPLSWLYQRLHSLVLVCTYCRQ